MEIRRLSLCLAFLLVAVISHSSEARHSLARRDTSDYIQDDAADQSDTEQNDADGGDEDGAEANATILTRPQSYSIEAGNTLRLECKIDIKNAIVEWKKDDSKVVVSGILMASQDKYALDGTNLIVKNLTDHDAGIYECLVTQLAPVSIQHHLAVLHKPKVHYITATDNGRPQLGSDLTLFCNATGEPAPTILWTKMENNNNSKVGEGPTYTIKDVKPEHSGRYLCYALGKKFSDTKDIHIVVQGKPHMHVPRTVINSAIGVEAILECSVHEKEPVTITWFKGNHQIDASRYKTQGTHSVLTVVPQNDEDFGQYTCKAECDVGTHHRTIELVQRPVVEDLAADGAKLMWRVHSHQPLKSVQIQLMSMGEESSPKPIDVPIPATRAQKYEMSHEVDSSVSPGNYAVVVKVENEKGMSESTDQIVYKQVEPEPVRAQVAHIPGAAHVSRPTTVLLSTVLMYLLVRTI